MPKSRTNATTPVFTNKPPLPEGWQWVRFDQIAINVSDRVDDPRTAGVEHYVGLEHLDSDSLKIRRWGTPEDVEAQKLRFRRGDIIFGKRRAYQRKVGVAEFDGICSAHAFVFRGNEKCIVPELLPFFMQTDAFMERAVAISKGSLSPTINWGDLARQEFALPSDLSEQRRIAELLRAADDAVEAWRGVLDVMQIARRSLIADMMLIDDSHPTVPLGEVCEFLDHKRVPLSESERVHRKGEYPYFGASGVIDHVDGYLFDEPLILLSEDGYNLVNRVTPIAFKVEGKIWVNNHAHVIRPNPEYRIDYLVEYLESISYTPYITGTYQKKINKSVCERIPVPEHTLPEQDAFLGRLRALDLAITTIINRHDVSKQLLGLLRDKKLTPSAEAS